MTTATDILHAIEARLDEDDKLRLADIHAPTEVAIPPGDAYRDLCVLPDGRIRHYGRRTIGGVPRRVYLESCNAGLDWVPHIVHDDREIGACIPSPLSGRWLTVASRAEFSKPLGIFPDAMEPHGTYAILSPDGPGGHDLAFAKITDEDYANIRQPLALRARRRIATVGQTCGKKPKHPVFLFSDDEVSWRVVDLEPAPRFEVVYPHKGTRWQEDACEPTLTELDDGTLVVLARTSQDFHYQYVSHDGGETWSKPAPSIFHGTITMPCFLRLADGRQLLFWCDTQPLPELAHDEPYLNAGERRGDCEDVFTNRDAAHAAVANADFTGWTGFREILLSAVRNNADYRVTHRATGIDKSVHQFQAVELPGGKVLVSLGQNEAARRLLIFDVSWLYEKTRETNFSDGLDTVSTHLFYKSLTGNIRDWDFGGHCAWNRMSGAHAVPSPDGDAHEVLKVSFNGNADLVSAREGVTWNFPAARRGSLELELRTPGAGVVLSLLDRWFNPSDVFAPYYAAFTCEVRDLPRDRWTLLRLDFDLDAGKLAVLADGAPFAAVELKNASPCGLNYLHLLSLAERPGDEGTLVKRLSATVQ